MGENNKEQTKIIFFFFFFSILGGKSTEQVLEWVPLFKLPQPLSKYYLTQVSRAGEACCLVSPAICVCFNAKRPNEETSIGDPLEETSIGDPPRGRDMGLACPLFFPSLPYLLWWWSQNVVTDMKERVRVTSFGLGMEHVTEHQDFQGGPPQHL